MTDTSRSPLVSARVTTYRVKASKGRAAVKNLTTGQTRIVPNRVKGRPASLELDDHMSRFQIADALEKMVFTAARDWRRTIRVDRNVRDMIVKALRTPRGVSQ